MQKLKDKLIITSLIMYTAMQPCFAVTLSPEMSMVAKKFILAMLGVLLSSFLIFIILTLYNKFFHNPNKNEKTTFDEDSLEPPQNLDGAISNFLNRTGL